MDDPLDARCSAGAAWGPQRRPKARGRVEPSRWARAAAVGCLPGAEVHALAASRRPKGAAGSASRVCVVVWREQVTSRVNAIEEGLELVHWSRAGRRLPQKAGCASHAAQLSTRRLKSTPKPALRGLNRAGWFVSGFGGELTRQVLTLVARQVCLRACCAFRALRPLQTAPARESQESRKNGARAARTRTHRPGHPRPICTACHSVLPACASLLALGFGRKLMEACAYTGCMGVGLQLHADASQPCGAPAAGAR